MIVMTKPNHSLSCSATSLRPEGVVKIILTPAAHSPTETGPNQVANKFPANDARI